ncbi:MAG TPA: hypothetical protein VK841_12100 [Polyangiaceae bacterium]|nr:hypothetical protein [Polyangiaceae bacterium]
MFAASFLAICSVGAASARARADEPAPAKGAAPSDANAAPSDGSAAPAHPQVASPEVPEERTANDAVYAEGLGPGLFYSVNYEHDFENVFGLRVGLGYVPVSATNGDGASVNVSIVAVPITFSYLGIGSLKHIFEVGAGGTILYVSGTASTVGGSSSGSGVGGIGALILGYRYQPPHGGFMFRAGIAPLITSFGEFLPWPYLSLGAAF